MARVHPTAVVAPEVELAEDVEIGPYCSLEGSIRIGAGTVLMGHNYFRGPLVIGRENRIYPFACLGFEPQDYKFDPARAGAGAVIGDRNVIREHVTIHRATSDDRPTMVGDDNMLMVGSHIGHDAAVGNRCVLANNALIGGHARIADQVNVAGTAGIAQHIAVGRLAFIGGVIGVTLHLPPFMIARYRNRVGGINIVGLRRSGMPRVEIDQVKWAWQVLFRTGNSRTTATAILEERLGVSTAIGEIVAFLRENSGPICAAEREGRGAVAGEWEADEG